MSMEPTVSANPSPALMLLRSTVLPLMLTFPLRVGPLHVVRTALPSSIPPRAMSTV